MESTSTRPPLLLNRVEVTVCVIAGILTAVAVVIAYASPSTGTNVLKDLILFSAGVGIAYAIQSASSRVGVNDRVRSLCSRSIQRLGLSAQQALSAAAVLRSYAVRPRSDSAEIVATMLDHLAEQAQVSMGDLEEMAGQKIGLDKLVADTLNDVASEAKRAAESASHTADPQEIQRSLFAISERLQRFEVQVKEAGLRTPRVSAAVAVCPECGREGTVPLGETPGDTAHVKCAQCAAAFPIHRVAGGGTRVGGVTRGGKQFVLACSNCQQPIRITVGEAEVAPLVRNCFNCKERLYIDAESRKVVGSEKRDPLRATYREEAGEAVFACPNCSTPIRSLPRPVIMSSCRRCTNLIMAIPAVDVSSVSPPGQPEP